ncbi:alpha-L-arabinofuranosidase C-terminal domain-containing protein [Salinifilum ghardaiensis]
MSGISNMEVFVVHRRSGRPGRGALGAAAAAALLPTLAIPSATAAETTDYAIQVRGGESGAALSENMYGVFFEDINHAADGGLYPERVRNRSFEYGPADNADFDPMTGWTAVSRGGDGRAEVVDDDGRLNERNRQYLRIDNAGGGEYGVTNAGYHSGMRLERGERYDVSVWARTGGAGDTPLTARVHTPDGTAVAEPVRLAVRGDGWSKYTATITARRTTGNGQLTVTAGEGSVALDVVSLFPQETFRDRPNGLRPDLAGAIAQLNPSFLRFPGGCLVNTGSHEGPDQARKRSYQWKDTIGPVEQRATNANFWGYNQSYGLGYYEYFQFAEDIGAEPIPVVPALVNGCGEDSATDDPALLRRHVQDTLDLIEFANGPVDSEWGAKRAAMGHPEPFGMERIAVGNEETQVDGFFEHFAQFREAIEQRHPEITVISNSGPDDSGPVFDRAWERNRQADVDVVDEHYYNEPDWFLRNNDRYDSYDRSGPDVFLGEYASQGNAFRNALAEAAYMTGLERNGDVVRMASYAPLLAKQGAAQWEPDMIWFNDRDWWGSANYEVQRLFMNNIGDHVVPSTADRSPGEPAAEPFRQVVTRDTRSGDLIVKVVNAQDSAARTRIDLGGAEVDPVARGTVLQAAPEAENTETDRPVRPDKFTVDGVGASFEHTFEPHSVTFLRIYER